VGLRTTAVEVRESTQVFEARQAVRGAAADAGLERLATDQAELAATELATNLVRHARHGVLLVTPGHGRLDLLSVDRGPGIPDVTRALRDGFTTAAGGSAGTGLGAVQRLADGFDLHTGAQGTVVLARFGAPLVVGGVQLGMLCVPYPGERVSGDAWGVEDLGDRVRLVVADGVGHGPEAAEASDRAVAAIRGARPGLGLTDAVEALGPLLRGSRGAAVTLVDLCPRRSTLELLGVGNVMATLVPPGERQRGLVVQHGTVGRVMRRLRSYHEPFVPGALLVVHSDGLGGRWRLTDTPGAGTRDPQLVAGLLYRDGGARRDDVTVVVVAHAQRRGVR
jgi:anti-sigma regulatory factor (Ser/Thr protein kinase)